MMFGYGGAGDGWPVWAVVLMWIGILAFLGVLTWGGYALMTSAARRSRQQRPGGSGVRERHGGADARQVLDERLARGEMDTAEYLKLRDLIADDDQAPSGTGSRQ